ncbi:MAG: RNA polymerase sigma factor [Spirochaetales bacterium]|nr:MAG: RNA polymerase sigma factor [Spirochaetales bacterium]
MESFDINGLIKTYGEKVFNLAYRITRNKSDAEDIVQETFIKVYNNLGTFRGDSAVYTWIFRIALNQSLQRKRQYDRNFFDSLDEKIEQFRDDVPAEIRDWENNPEKQYLYEELLQEIRKECYLFMSFRLTDDQRVVYVLRNILGFPLKDIGLILDIGLNTVKARLQRAKANLRTYFNRNCQWTEGMCEEKKCTCESRIGFALALYPGLLKRLRQTPMNRDTKKMIEATLSRVENIDEVYRSLPSEPYNADLLAQEILNIK